MGIFKDGGGGPIPGVNDEIDGIGGIVFGPIGAGGGGGCRTDGGGGGCRTDGGGGGGGPKFNGGKLEPRGGGMEAELTEQIEGVPSTPVDNCPG